MTYESRLLRENEVKNYFFERRYVVVSHSNEITSVNRERCQLDRIDFATLVQ